MKTREQQLAEIEVYRTFILNANPTVTNNAFILFQYIRNYLAPSQQGHPSSVNLAASILCDVFMQCSQTLNLSGNIVDENEDAIIKMLTVFDIYFDSIQTKFPDENGSLIVVAAFLMKYNSSLSCEFYTQVNNGNPYIIGVADALVIEQDTAELQLTPAFDNDTYQNMPDGVNTTGLTIEIITPPAHGTIDVGPDIYTNYYRVDTGYTGTDSFTFRYLLDGLPVAQSAPFFTVNINVSLPEIYVIYNGRIDISVSSASTDNVINVADSDTLVGITRETPGFAVVILQQPEAGFGTCTVDVDNNILYTHSGIGTEIGFIYGYTLNGNPIPVFEVNSMFQYVYVDFFNPRISLCTENVQGRITYTQDYRENQLTPTPFIENIEITEVELIVPTATPPSVLDTTLMTNMITPTGNQRAEIANVANTENKFRISISYDELGVPKTGYFECDLPNFQLTDNLCENNIDAVFTSTTA